MFLKKIKKLISMNKYLLKKGYSVLLFLFGIHNVIYSQQAPEYTQYTYNMQVINPAYVGSRETLNINMLGRSQWTGVEGSPKTSTLSINTPLGRKKVGGGLSIIYDQFGPLKETHLYADVSYTLDTSYKGNLAFGLKGGFSFQNIDTSILRFNEEQIFGIDFNTNSYANFGFGMYYYQDDFYAGISIPNILNNNFFRSTDTGAISEVGKNNVIYINSGFVYHINENLQIKPAMLLKYETIFPLSLDISATAFIQSKVELGVSYRLKKSLSFITAFFVSETLRIGYAYDYTVGNLSEYSSGSHEIMLLFDMPKKEKEHRVRYY